MGHFMSLGLLNQLYQSIRMSRNLGPLAVVLLKRGAPIHWRLTTIHALVIYYSIVDTCFAQYSGPDTFRCCAFTACVPGESYLHVTNTEDSVKVRVNLVFASVSSRQP